jgi:hypothetical protein
MKAKNKKQGTTVITRVAAVAAVFATLGLMQARSRKKHEPQPQAAAVPAAPQQIT